MSARPITFEIEFLEISGFAGIRMSRMNRKKYSNTKKFVSGNSFNIYKYKYYN